MSFFRVAFAFVFSLIAAVIFIVVGTLLGSFIAMFISSQQAPVFSPLDALQQYPAGALIGGGIGGAIGLAIMVSTIKRAADVNWLKKNGVRIMASVTNIQTRRESRQVSTGSGGYRTEWSTYYYIIARGTHPATGKTHTYTSHRLSIYPRRYTQGTAIAVLIDPQNPGRYLVEV